MLCPLGNVKNNGITYFLDNAIKLATLNLNWPMQQKILNGLGLAFKYLGFKFYIIFL